MPPSRQQTLRNTIARDGLHIPAVRMTDPPLTEAQGT